MFARVSVYEIPADRMGEATSEFQEALEQISKLDGSVKHFFHGRRRRSRDRDDFMDKPPCPRGEPDRRQ